MEYGQNICAASVTKSGQAHIIPSTITNAMLSALAERGLGIDHSCERKRSKKRRDMMASQLVRQFVQAAIYF